MAGKTKTARERAVDAVNTVRAHATEAYKNEVPKVTYGSDYKTAMASIVKYTPYFNEFVSGLVNRIILAAVEAKTWRNPLEIFKRDGVPLGTDIELAYVNPGTAKAYDPNGGAAGLFEVNAPDVKVQYFRRNRQDKYKLTLNRQLLAGGFTSWEELDGFISKATASLYSGNVIDEYNLTKKLVSEAVTEEAMRKVEVTYTPGSEASGNAILSQLRALFYNFQFPSANYNNYKAYADKQSVDGATDAVTWVENNDIVLLIRNDVLADVNVNTLAGAFNLDRADFMGRLVPVDTFGYYAGDGTKYSRGTFTEDPNKILAVLMDRAAVQVRTNMEMAADFLNADTLNHHFYNHVWQTYSFNLCADSVALVEPSEAA